jgi:hypothetical protein
MLAVPCCGGAVAPLFCQPEGAGAGTDWLEEDSLGGLDALGVLGA